MRIVKILKDGTWVWVLDLPIKGKKDGTRTDNPRLDR